MRDIEIFELDRVNDDTVVVLSRLMSQLVDEKIDISAQYLESIIKSDNCHLFLVKKAENIIGSFSLVMYLIPTGLKASLEDVVVDVSTRGRGVGECMLKFAIDYARSRDVCRLDLTSRPERISANALYQKIGFVRRETNVYRIELN